MSDAANALIASLRSKGADQIDPVRFRYIEALATRALAHQGEVRRILDGKVVDAVNAYGKHVEQSQNKVICPDKATRSTPLADLVRDIGQPQPAGNDGTSDALATARPELRAIQQFRSTWSQLSVDRQVRQAIRQGPENAGPLNSHMLVLRSLELMRDISPEYLNRFMSYVDALLWLDQVDNQIKPTTKKAAATKNRKKKSQP